MYCTGLFPTPMHAWRPGNGDRAPRGTYTVQFHGELSQLGRMHKMGGPRSFLVSTAAARIYRHDRMHGPRVHGKYVKLAKLNKLSS